MSDNRDHATELEGMTGRNLDLIVSLAKAALPNLTGEAKVRVTRSLKNIDERREDMLLILSGRAKHPRHRAPWYVLTCFNQLLIAALEIGSHCSIPDSVRVHIHSGGTRVARARKDQGSAEINEIIREEAEGLWSRKPSFRNNLHGTAETIKGSVLDRVREMSKQGVIPEAKVKSLSGGAIKKRLERMRGSGQLAVVLDI